MLRQILSARRSPPPFRIAIIGSGPAGCYTAKYLLKQASSELSAVTEGDKAGSNPAIGRDVQVDILDGSPVPFGLVRFGVAPDHPEVKAVVNDFSEVLSDVRCSFYGNIHVLTQEQAQRGPAASVEAPARDAEAVEAREHAFALPLSLVRQHYDATVLACGAQSDRVLGVPGESELDGVFGAREFVNWYNGHPAYQHRSFGLPNAEAVAVVGQGNVAIDVARILLSPVEELAKTDIARHALAELSQSSVKHVYLFGRRGPVQASFTIKELREVSRLPGVELVFEDEDIEEGYSGLSMEEMKARAVKRKAELLRKLAEESKAKRGEARDDVKRLHFRFFAAPESLVGAPRVADAKGNPVGPPHVMGINLRRTKLEGDEPGKQRAVHTDEVEHVPVDLVLRSIGYKSTALYGAPFSDETHTVPNTRGRVNDEQRLYVSGWLKRGPRGIIATNVTDARETVRAVWEDLSSSSDEPAEEKQGFAGLQGVLAGNGVQVVDWHGWQAIAAEEARRGAKITDTGELLELGARKPQHGAD